MIVPVFRAEKSNTTFHLTEVTQMDIEIAFANDDDAIKLLKDAVLYIIKQVIKRNLDDLKTLGIELAVPKVKTVTYTAAVKALRKQGVAINQGRGLFKRAGGKTPGDIRRCADSKGLSQKP